MAKHEKTSPKVASKASKALRDQNSTKNQKAIAGSALTQTNDKKASKKKK